MNAQNGRPTQHQVDSDVWTAPSEHNSTTTFELTEPPANAISIEDVPPDGGYGWVCTVCVFLVNAHTWGINSVGSHTVSEDQADLYRHGLSSLLTI